jgi:hypothetical protein
MKTYEGVESAIYILSGCLRPLSLSLSLSLSLFPFRLGFPIHAKLIILLDINPIRFAIKNDLHRLLSAVSYLGNMRFESLQLVSVAFHGPRARYVRDTLHGDCADLVA